jgi:hypothetical protein
MDPILIVVLVVLGAAGGVIGYRVVRARRAAEEEPLYHFKCPGCKRRLGYRAKQVGHQGMCPQCKQRLVFPSPDEVKRPGSKH